MEISEMVRVLRDKGHSTIYAHERAELDYEDMKTDECSVCRRTMTRLEMRYHYHPCE